MGFVTVTKLNLNDSTFAYQILSQCHRLPKSAKPAKVEVAIYYELQRSKITPYSRVRPTAVQTPDGVIHLAERIVCFTRLHPNVGDPIFKIAVNGVIRFCDKAKRPQAEALGIQRCSNGYYLDRIQLGN